MDDPNLRNGLRCPVCDRDVGFKAVWASRGIYWVDCPHCRAELEYRDAASVVFPMFVGMLGLSLAIALGTPFIVFPVEEMVSRGMMIEDLFWPCFLVAVPAMVIAALLSSVGMAIYLRCFGELQMRAAFSPTTCGLCCALSRLPSLLGHRLFFRRRDRAS